MAVQPDEPEVAGGEHAADGGHGRATGERQTELLVFVRRGDEFVGVCLDTDGDPDEDVLHDTQLTGDLVEAVDLGHRVEHDVPDTGAHGAAQFVHGLVVAVHVDAQRVEPAQQVAPVAPHPWLRWPSTVPAEGSCPCRSWTASPSCRTTRGTTWRVPSYTLGVHVVWGMTERIFRNLLSLIQ